jgi:hypothetical protein
LAQLLSFLNVQVKNTAFSVQKALVTSITSPFFRPKSRLNFFCLHFSYSALESSNQPQMAAISELVCGDQDGFISDIDGDLSHQ